MARMTRNIVANLAGRLWAFASIFVFVPLYVRLLGIEAYGVITFYNVLLLLLTFADAGFTATLNREFARESGDERYKANLLRTFERIYLAIALLIVCTVFFFAGPIVDGFLKSQTIPRGELVHHVRVMGLTVGFSIFATLYQGGLMGLQRQVQSNAVAICYNAVRAGLVVVPLLAAPSLYVYFYWQLGVTILYCAVLRVVVGRTVAVGGARSDMALLRNLWRYTLGMMAMAVIYAVNTQVDKLLVGNILSLADFGYYNLATQFAQAALILCSPLAVAFFPELTRQVSLADGERVRKLCRRFAFLITAPAAAATFVLMLYAGPYIAIWQHDAAIAAVVAPVARAMLPGCFFLALQLVPYYLALANGHTRTNVVIGVVSICLVTVGVYCFAGRYGLVGAAAPWLVVNFLATFFLGARILPRYLPDRIVPWLGANVLLPLAVTLVAGGVAASIFALLPQGVYTLLYGVAIFAVCSAANGLVFLRINPEINIKNYIKWPHRNFR